MAFVDRGDPDAPDKTKDTLTLDGNWQDWDTSSIVPVEANAILIRVEVKSGTGAFSFWLRTNGNVNTTNVAIVTALSDNFMRTLDAVVACDSAQIVEYAKVGTGSVDICNLTVAGWWTALPDTSDWPRSYEPKVEDKTNPPKVANPAPEFSWQYDDPKQRPQSAFHLLVASSNELLDENVGDLWDSDVVLSDAHQAKYQGVELGSETTYFWKVRVRNSEGTWSAQW